MNWVVLAREHLRVESFHSLRSEWRHLHNHLVEDASSTPNVTSVVIGHVFPDFWAGIVRRAGLSSFSTCDFLFLKLKTSIFSFAKTHTFAIQVLDR